MGKQYKNVKCKLKSILVDNDQNSTQQRLVSEIEKRCLAVSRMVVKASLFCELMIERLLEEGTEEWPDFSKLNTFVSMLTIGNNKRKKRNSIPAIEKTWEQHENVLQEYTKHIHRYHSDYNLINYSAKTFQTAFFNNLKLNFISRQRRTIRQQIRESSTTKIYALQCFINNWDYKGRTFCRTQLEQLKTTHWHWIEKHRDYLPKEKRISEQNLTPKQFIKYYNFLKTNSNKLKKIKLVPENKIKAHYVDFDAAGVKGLCHEIGFDLYKLNLENKLEKEGWDKVFNLKKIDKLTSSKWTFDRCIATDGVSCSIRYYKQEPTTSKNKKLKTSDNTFVKIQHPIEKKETNLSGKRIIGIDPGRKNIAFCVELDPQTRKIVKKTKLTSKQYYCDSGFTKYKNKVQKWLTKNEDYKTANEQLSQTNNTLEYLNVLNNHQDVIWQTKTAKKWRNGKFRVYCLKKKTLDNFINKVIGDGPFHVAFGAAKFTPTGRGEHYSSPSSLLGKLMKKRIGEENFSLVDEWNTSKICHRCFQPLTRVKDEERDVYLRGLLHCSLRQSDLINDATLVNTTCPISGSFVDRDSNAATNIALKKLDSTIRNLQTGVRVQRPNSAFVLRRNHQPMPR